MKWSETIYAIYDSLFLCSNYQHMSAQKQMTYSVCNICTQCNMQSAKMLIVSYVYVQYPRPVYHLHLYIPILYHQLLHLPIIISLLFVLSSQVRIAIEPWSSILRRQRQDKDKLSEGECFLDWHEFLVLAQCVQEINAAWNFSPESQFLP